jgi:Carbon-nitrogen hydrolase
VVTRPALGPFGTGSWFATTARATLLLCGPTGPTVSCEDEAEGRYLPVPYRLRRAQEPRVRSAPDQDRQGDRGADVAHFPETCLSGYAGVDIASHEGFDWPLLEGCVQRVLDLAWESHIWVLLGSAHRLTAPHKPHNSLYVIDDRGEIVDRYDKMFCAGDRSEDTGELAHYSPGGYFCVFSIEGVRCGALICHEYRYPELYREYKRRGVQLMFHSFHAGNIPPGAFGPCRMPWATGTGGSTRGRR